MEGKQREWQITNSWGSFSIKQEKIKQSRREENRPAITAKSFWVLPLCCSLSLFAVTVWSGEDTKNRRIHLCLPSYRRHMYSINISDSSGTSQCHRVSIPNRLAAVRVWPMLSPGQREGGDEVMMCVDPFNPCQSVIVNEVRQWMSLEASSWWFHWMLWLPAMSRFTRLPKQH